MNYNDELLSSNFILHIFAASTSVLSKVLLDHHIMEFNFNKLFNPEPDASNGDDFFGPRISKTNEAWKVDFDSPNNGNFCWWTLNSTEVDTISAYSNALSDLGGVLFLLLSILGLILNFLLIVVLLKNSKIRQEYMTKTVVSIAINDFCWSILLFPCKSLRFFLR